MRPRSLMARLLFISLWVGLCGAKKGDEGVSKTDYTCGGAANQTVSVVPSSSKKPSITDFKGIQAWRKQHLPPVMARCSGGKLLPHQLLFDHIMKTGGVFVDFVLEQNCKGMMDIDCYMAREEVIHKFLPVAAHHVAGKDEDVDSCHNHAPILTTHKGVRDIFGAKHGCPDIARSASVFTVLRDPVARCFSLYKYTGRQEDSCFRWMPLLQVLENVQKGIAMPECRIVFRDQWSNQMVRQLSTSTAASNDTEKHLKSAKENLAFRFTVVGLTERMDDTMALLHHKLPVWFRNVSIEEPVNVTPPTPQKLLDLWVLDNATRDKLIEMNMYDVELYNYAVQLFEGEMKDLSSS